jgi:hypothetical protein
MLCGEPISHFEDFLNNSSQARFDVFKSCCLGAILNPKCTSKATVPLFIETDLFMFPEYFMKWQKRDANHFRPATSMAGFLLQ